MYVCKLQPAYDNTGEQVIWQSLLLLQIYVVSILAERTNYHPVLTLIEEC